MPRISELPRRDKHPELRAAITEVIGHDRFIFVVLAEETDGTLTRMSISDETLAVMTALAKGGSGYDPAEVVRRSDSGWTPRAGW